MGGGGCGVNRVRVLTSLHLLEQIAHGFLILVGSQGDGEREDVVLSAEGGECDDGALSIRPWQASIMRSGPT